MNKKVLFGTVLAGAVTFSIGAVSANASTMVQSGQTGTAVEIIDDTTETPLLVLESVPKNYNFETTLQNQTYVLTATNLVSDAGEIVVLNGSTTQSWSVKASLVDNKITNSKGDFEVNSFTINGTDIVTGVDGVVISGDGSSTGEISEAVTGLGISFSDGTNLLEVGDQLSGTVNYSLVNTSTAE